MTMTQNPYDVLGVSKTATQDEIKKAYRKRAKALHPDLHPDDPEKQAAFQAAAAAYDLLSDPVRRRRFDVGEIDASGQERHGYRHYADEAAGAGFGGQGFGQGFGGGFGKDFGKDFGPGVGGGFGVGQGEDLSDLFSRLFGRGARGGPGHPGVQTRGEDLRYNLEVEFLDAARGGKRAVTMPDGNRIEITIPAGVRDGQTLRLRGKGAPGQGQAGDALVTIAVKPHPVFVRDGDDIEIDLPITFDEAVLGARVDVPTIHGPVTMTIPAGASSGQRLRLKGKGIRRGKSAGDQHVRLKIVLPKGPDDEMRRLARRWRDHSRFDPRAELRRKT
ncbi:DnaJ C-terminal domain-containing protein [Marinovum sp.]|uniref:DnaJ C-terminal domain-containing protein n=1 Tax=Marinovum sp. TaxID=2024839 RepID=UPI003A8E1AFA